MNFVLTVIFRAGMVLAMKVLYENIPETTGPIPLGCLAVRRAEREDDQTSVCSVTGKKTPRARQCPLYMGGPLSRQNTVKRRWF